MIMSINFIINLLFSLAFAQTCTDSDNGTNKFIEGKIVYSLSSSACLNQECYQNFMRDSDYCSSNTILVEFSCENNLPQKSEIRCENGCSQGKCL